MSKIYDLILEYCNNIPEDLKTGVLYFSKEYEIAIHLCACGCGKQSVTPIGNEGWSLFEKEGLVTLNPSIGNWKWKQPYHAHYFITNGKIMWC